MNPSATIFNSVTSKNTFTAVLIPALFLAFALGLAGCDGQPGLVERNDTSGTEASKASEATEYEITMTDLGTLGGRASRAFSINDKGQIVGVSHCKNGEEHAFLWEDGKMESLGKLGGAFRGSSAAAINETGQIVGINDGSYTGLPRTVAFLWENGTMNSLSNIHGRERETSTANSINNKGQVAGYMRIAYEYDNHAVIWENGGFTNLSDMIGKTGQAVDINDTGQVLVQSDQPYIWDDGNLTALDSLGEGYTEGNAINEAGQIVGSSEIPSGFTHAFLWEDGEMIDLGALINKLGEDGTSRAFSINDKGQVVGSSVYSLNRHLGPHAFFWEDGTMIDLGDLLEEHANSAAVSINNNGQIVGWSETENSFEWHAVVWEIKKVQE